MLTTFSNLGYLTDFGLEFFPDKAAILQDDLVLTFAQLDERANRIANGLVDVGVAKGDRVALLFPNDYRYVESLLGVMRAGAVAVPVNVRLGFEGIVHTVVDSRARVLLSTADLAEMAVEVSAETPTTGVVIAPGLGAGQTFDYDSFVSGADPARPTVSVGSDDICLQPYTSGSTGRPKGVLLHHGGQIANADTVRRIHLLSADERALVAVPIYHANAMTGAVQPFLMAGGSIVILPAFDPKRVIEAISRYGCTFTTGVPAMYRMVLDQKAALAANDVSSIRFLLCGSAPVPAEMLSELADVFTGAVIVEGYGLTEGGPVVSCSPRWGIRKLGSAGLPLPDVQVRVVRDDGGEADADEAGELWVRSPGNAKGYFELPELTAQRFLPGGWLRTGDYMRRDRDGYLYFVGRRDDMINSGGENVYPKEVESILLQHPAVTDVCVVGMPHAVKGEVPVAFAVTRDPRPTEQELKDFFLARGAAYAHPRRVLFVPELPLNGVGKIDRAALKREARGLAEAGQPARSGDGG